MQSAFLVLPLPKIIISLFQINKGLFEEITMEEEDIMSMSGSESDIDDLLDDLNDLSLDDDDFEENDEDLTDGI